MAELAEDFSARRKDRLLREHEHDTYRARYKLPEPTACPECGAVYRHGRWQWAPVPPGVHEETCPACHRIRDRCPAGSVTVSGAFAMANRHEIKNLAHNEETRAKMEHPLERLIAIESDDDNIVITTTGAHLARGIGEALRRAYQGTLDFRYVEESPFLRVTWSR
jgi:hypothetical protein